MADTYRNGCGLALANDSGGGPEEGVPCPACGSTSRRIDEYITLSVRPDMGLGMAAKRAGK